jgi:hypothetical protein
MTPVAGAYPIQGVGKLPNVDIANPGEVWSNLKANGNIVPGACIAPVVGATRKYKQVAAGGDAPQRRQVGIALRTVEVPDINTGPSALGPNEIINQMIADGDWLRLYLTGSLHLTLITPRTDYQPGQLIGWNPAGARPVGKAAGTGSWTNQAGDILANTDIFEVLEFRPYGGGNEGLLTVHFLRGSED